MTTASTPSTPSTVTIVTRRAATADSLTPADYREIYDELRSRMTLRQFAEQIGTAVSFAWWGKYEHGAAHLDRARKAELRRAVGLPELPPTVAEAIATADPDAAVWQVGAGPADRIILVGDQAPAALALHLNGDLHAAGEPAPGGHVTPVTAPRRPATRASIHLPIAAWQRLNTARQAAGQSWEQFLARLADDTR